MDPARVMGTFLRTWREAWLGLSRGELCYRVNGLNRKARLTTEVVRRWEQGQAPMRSAQLEALLRVMRGENLNGREGRLSSREAVQFLDLCITAPGARRYSDLLPDDCFGLRTDVRKASQAVFGSKPQAPIPLTVMHIVTAIGDILGALADARHLNSSRDAVRDRQVAAAWLQAALAGCHNHSGRHRLSAGASFANAEFLESHFGQTGIGHFLCPIAQRGSAVHALALASPSTPFDRLLAVSEEAGELGNQVQAIAAFFGAVGRLAHMPGMAFGPLRDRAETYLELAKRLEPDGLAMTGHISMAGALQADGDWCAAEEHLLALTDWADTSSMARVLFESAWGRQCSHTGQPDEGQEHYERALAVARDNGFDHLVRSLSATLESLG